MSEQIDRDSIETALHDVDDPETGLDIVDLGLVYDIVIAPGSGSVVVVMTFTTPSCPAGEVMMDGVRRRIGSMSGVSSVEVELTFEPRWTPSRISDAGREYLGMS